MGCPWMERCRNSGSAMRRIAVGRGSTGGCGLIRPRGWWKKRTQHWQKPRGLVTYAAKRSQDPFVLRSIRMNTKQHSLKPAKANRIFTEYEGSAGQVRTRMRAHRDRRF